MHGRPAERGEIDQRARHPRRPDRPRRIVGLAEGQHDLLVEGERLPFHHLAGQLEEDEQQDAAAEADEQPRQLVALEPRQPREAEL